MIGFIAAAALAVTSQVTGVTVFNDRAQVERSTEVELRQGMNTVVFGNLPEAIDARGIQVEGSGAATVLDVRFKTENFEQVPDEAWKQLYGTRDALMEEEKAVDQRIQRLHEAKRFLASISDKVTHTAQKEGQLELGPERWERMLALYADRSAGYDAGLLEAEQELKSIRAALEKVRADIRDAGAGMRKQRRIVEVDLEAEQAGKAKLALSYLVAGPSWKPTYDVRVDTKTRQMEVKYFALVRQNTGEDWGNVALKLSTARPGLGGQHPELPVWRIDVQRPVEIAEVHRFPQSYSVETGQRTAPVIKPLDWANHELVASLGFAPELSTRGATTTSQGTAVLFEVKGNSQIDSDNVEHRVAVANLSLPAHLRYSCVPKLDKHVYLKAKGTNAADYPLLRGKSNIFLDGSYVATSEMDLVSPGEDFWAFLGVDESMKVEYKRLNKHESSKGLTGRTARHTYEYQFKIKNTHSVPEELIVFDQLPISGNEEIKIKLVEPKHSENTDALEINDEQRIKWFFVLEPGEERVVPFTFHVEAPQNVDIEGLE